MVQRQDPLYAEKEKLEFQLELLMNEIRETKAQLFAVLRRIEDRKQKFQLLRVERRVYE